MDSNYYIKKSTWSSYAPPNVTAPAAAQKHKGVNLKLEMQDVSFKQNWGCIWGDEKLIEKWGEQYEKWESNAQWNAKCPSFQLSSNPLPSLTVKNSAWHIMPSEGISETDLMAGFH